MRESAPTWVSTTGSPARVPTPAGGLASWPALKSPSTWSIRWMISSQWSGACMAESSSFAGADLVLGVRYPEERELGQQIPMWFDGLGAGLPVDHEDHPGGEDVVGRDPAVGIVRRPGAVVVKDVGQQSEGRIPGFVRWITMPLEGLRQRLQVVLHV